MDPIVIAAIIASLGVIVTALLAFLAPRRGVQNTRMTHLEDRLEKAELVNRGMWIWNIGLQAQVINREPPPPREPPPWLPDLLDK
ncbi:hypothetical protein [Paeniglutamicibacter terrestris]|uniref:Uncharacterized protein n=1 Tax=Paeniglutamicibacter terrestris TaxID=2723403 RepID=A0ABX1G531_9MICC|nr:hypothetical protein [Paeniglutamicibacter terrestris]NKG21124.1 hypothetical protein [Paeniglutamicibacter terrestris]